MGRYIKITNVHSSVVGNVIALTKRVIKMAEYWQLLL